MEINCNNPSCKAPILKSYGKTYKLRSRHMRWDSLNDTAIIQCNICRSFQDIPLGLKVVGENVILEVATEIKKSASAKEKLVVQKDVNEKVHAKS